MISLLINSTLIVKNTAAMISLALSSAALFLVVATSCISVAAVDVDPASNDPCRGRRIHILPLPPRFNTHLLRHCAAFPLSGSGDGDSDGDFCDFLANHGLGPRTHNRSISWYRTDHRALEPYFHRRLLDYPCLVDSPAPADAIFLPYYASLDALPFRLDPDHLNSSILHGADLASFLHSYHSALLRRRRGHDFFLLLAGVAWDYDQELDTDPRLAGSTSFLRLPEFLNFTILTLESRAWPWQEHAVPYPTSFHPPSPARLAAWLSRAARADRRILMLYAGGGVNAPPPARPNIGSAIIAECTNRTQLCTLVDCSGGACAHSPILYMKPMLRASFCLQPPGDTPTRRSTFDAIVAGCIPVFFEDQAARTQYGWHLPTARMHEFSLTIPKESVVTGAVVVSNVLAAVPPADVRRMRKRVLELAPRVIYRRHGELAEVWAAAGKDAADLAVEGVLHRVRRRVAALNDGDLDRLYSEDDDDGDLWAV